eukprot:3298058-Ditylum_brightwellii.AAC.1
MPHNGDTSPKILAIISASCGIIWYLKGVSITISSSISKASMYLISALATIIDEVLFTVGILFGMWVPSVG